MTTLPIEKVLPSLKESLRSYMGAVLVAPPGAGKTTRVPFALLNEPWLAGRRILMLEPRRLATRSAAQYMADSLGERVGETVGYRVRQDTRVGPKTKIEVITEGVLTRLLQNDPSLENVGAVIFDEFHERSLHADLGLALCLQSQGILREDLRILVMSATLVVEPIAKLLGNAPVITSEGRSFPIETQYLPHPIQGSPETAVARTIVQALESNEGNILVFLPGVAEIRRVEGYLKDTELKRHIKIVGLYGQLTQEAQSEAITLSAPRERKVVLATSIAETSLTVEGVRVVVDSGFMRVPRFSPRTGMTRLETIPVSRASADQRRGRAGRVAPGVCYRMWTEQQNRQLIASNVPEIMEADLVPFALELAVWGVRDPAELSWLDPPPEAALSQARELLIHLGALDNEGEGRITARGRQMAELGIHPRLAHMVLLAHSMNIGGLACEIAAILGERDILRGVQPSIDLRLRIEAVRSQVDGAGLKRIHSEIRSLKQTMGIPKDEIQSIDHLGLLLALAYPDRIAQRRPDGRYLLCNGRGAVVGRDQPLGASPYLVAAELDDKGVESRILLAAPVTLKELEDCFASQIKKEAFISWDKKLLGVRARKRDRLGALILKEMPNAEPDPQEMVSSLIEGIAEEGLSVLPWPPTARQLQQRLVFMNQIQPGWTADMSDEALSSSIAQWLGPHLFSLKNLQQLNLTGILEGLLSWDQRKQLDWRAPTHITVPSGSRIPIDYTDPLAPALSVRLQELFGLTETPRIGGGNVSLTIHLLSPAHRPVQVTRDLASFWSGAYYEIKKDLKGRYPKHYWPDDPLAAIPTNRTRPRM